MKLCHAIFSTFVVFFVASGAGEKQGESQLQQIYDELSILSRVTNAIALQAAALSKTVKIREVITELLKVDNGNFSNLLSLDPAHLVKNLDELHKKSLQAVSGSNEQLQQDLKEMIAMNGLLAAVESENYTEKATVNSLIVLKKVDEKMEICDESLITIMFNISQAMSGVPFAESDEMKIFSSMKTMKKAFYKCISKFPAFMQKLYEYNYPLSGFLELNDTMNTIKALNELDIANKIPNMLQKFKTPFLNILAVGDHRNKGNTGKLLQSAITLFKKTVYSNSSTRLFLTAGFPESGDMKRVAKDLTSDWFKKKVSRGKSTAELETALKPFNQFAESMAHVFKSWNNFRDDFQTDSALLATIPDLLSQIDDYDRNVDKKKFLENFEATFRTCFKNYKNALDQGEETKFLKNFSAVYLLVRSVQAVEQWASEISTMFDEKAMDVYFEELEKLTPSNIKEQVEKITNFDDFLKIINKFTMLKSLQTQYESAYKTSNSSELSLSKIITDAGLVDTSKCLEKDKLDSSKLLKMLQFMQHMMQLDIDYSTLKANLDNFFELKKKMLETEKLVKGFTSRSARAASNSGSPVLKIKDSQKHADHLGNGLLAIKKMIISLKEKATILKSTMFNAKANQEIREKNPIDYIKEFWTNPGPSIEKLVSDLEKLEQSSKSYRKADLLTIRKVFEDGSKIVGIPEVFSYIDSQFEKKGSQYSNERKITQALSTLDLNFASHKGALSAASLSVDNLKLYFDDLFGLTPKVSVQSESTSPIVVVLICVAIVLVLVILAIVGYGFTSNGRNQYINLYLYYFGKTSDYEKRWRYSLFMDRVDGKNVLIDSVREINATNLLKAVKRGAYINVCNKYGNTALHVATRRGYQNLVEILIKHGADRSFLNPQNKTAEQMIPVNYQETHKEKIERFKSIESIYNKYRKKKFKLCVPEKFPVSSFHIYIEDRTDDNVTNEFTTKFQSITSDEAMITTTHVVVKTTEDGILETDDLNLLIWIFHGSIIVRDTWMVDCLRDEKLIEKDCDYLVEKVKYKGIIYDTVTQWSNAMAKATTPFLYGVHVALCMKNCPYLASLTAIIQGQGGTMLDKFPDKDAFNKGSHPYLHKNLGPIFLLHDGTGDLDLYRSDPDKMFTLFTEQQFMDLLFKREINKDTNPKIIPVLVDEED